MPRAADLLDPDAYVRNGYPWQAWADLRRHDPVSRRAHGEMTDYWALVRHAEIAAVSRRPRDFISSPRPVGEVSARLPLAVIMELLGVPHDDRETLLVLANQTVGAGDPEYDQGATSSNAAAVAAREAMFEVFPRHIAERRKEPRDDLRSALVGADLGRRPPSDYEVLSYCFLLAAVLALSERPGELAGRQIRAGDTLVLFHPSAGRDEAAFANPEDLDLARSPAPHVSSGSGEHYCLGASLAKLELECIFRELAARGEHVELAGPVERLRATGIGGVKRIPVRIALA